MVTYIQIGLIRKIMFIGLKLNYSENNGDRNLKRRNVKEKIILKNVIKFAKFFLINNFVFISQNILKLSSNKYILQFYLFFHHF